MLNAAWADAAAFEQLPAPQYAGKAAAEVLTKRAYRPG